MAPIMETVIHVFKENNWPYIRQNEGSILQAVFRGENGEWSSLIYASEEQQRFVFYSICPVQAAENMRMAVAEFITRLNYGLGIGNFELKFEDGEIRLKTCIYFEKDSISKNLVAWAILTNLEMMDDCLPSLMKVINGDTSPAQAVAEIKGMTKADRK